MNESDKIRVSNIGRLAILGIIVIGASYIQNTPLNLLLLKLLIVPMFWLAIIGLGYLYKDPISKQKTISVNVIEHQALFVLLFASFLILVLWSPEINAIQIFRGLAASLAFGVPVLLYMHSRQQTPRGYD